MPRRAFVHGQCVFGILQLEDIPGNQLAFAGAAVAGLATVGEADSVSQQRTEHGFALLCGADWFKSATVTVRLTAYGGLLGDRGRCGLPSLPSMGTKLLEVKQSADREGG